MLKFQTGFFVAEDFMMEGDRHKSVDGSISYTYSPGYLLPFNRLEFSFASDGKYQPMTLPEEGQRNDGYFGNLTAGLKVLAVDSRYVDVGLAAIAKLFNQEETAGLAPASLSPTFLILGTVDLQDIRFHLNAGLYNDHSQKALLTRLDELSRPLRFAQGVYIEDSWVLGVVMEVPVGNASAFIEGFTYQDRDGKALSSETSGSRSTAMERRDISFLQNPVWLTPGLKARVSPRWVVDGAMDVGLLTGDFPGFLDTGILPPWRFVFGLSYLTGVPESPRRGREDSTAAGGGRLVGRVMEAGSDEPLENVTIAFSDPQLVPRVTIPGGHFEVEHFPSGDYAVVASLGGYETLTQKFQIREGEVFNLSLPLVKGSAAAAKRTVAKAKSEGVHEKRIVFEFGKVDLPSESYPVLDRLAELLRSRPEVLLRIEGHTDGIGEFAVNQILSRGRAIVVADYLAAKGINRKRLVPIGLGPRYPSGTNATEEGRQKNRRVEFELIPLPLQNGQGEVSK